MSFASPLWLLTLIPWAALVLWLLWGRRERVGVPFLALWRDDDARPASRRAVHAPPLPIVLMLLTVLLAILAAGSPVLSRQEAPPITVLVDRGVTMSARDGDAYRYVRAAEMLEPHVRGPASIVPVPSRDARMTDAAGIVNAVGSLPPTALDTSKDIAQAAMRLLGTTHGPVVVLSDQPIDVAEPRLVVVTPPVQPNVGIVQVAARERPAAQVMVRLDAEGRSTQTLRISSDGERVERTIDAPGTAFIDLPRLEKTVEVALAPGDPLAADDRAWLVRETGWPRIEALASVPPELARMTGAYRKIRPPREDARIVPIVESVDQAAGEAVVLAPAAAVAGNGAPAVVDHPVTAGVAWPDVLAGARLGETAPPGFMPLVSAGERVAVAVRGSPRQVWVAIDSPSFARRADYVVFWTNVFDWLGGGGADAFVAHPIELLGAGWRRITDGPSGTEPGLWPGVYQRGDGTLRAVNAGAHATPPSVPIHPEWQRRLARLATTGAAQRNLSPYLLLAALACALGAAIVWPARRRAPAAAQT